MVGALQRALKQRAKVIQDESGELTIVVILLIYCMYTTDCLLYVSLLYVDEYIV